MGRYKSRRGRDGTKGLRRTIRQDAWTDDDPGRPEADDEERPPEILLRQMASVEALAFLEMMIERHRNSGVPRVLVVHGKGLRSDGGVPVLAPLVRAWLQDHPDEIADVKPAPPRWGGDGALLVSLRS